MSWTQRGLAPLADDAPRRAVLGSGRVLARGVDERRAWRLESLSERWVVTASEVSDVEPRPVPGDVVIFRGESGRRRGWLWGAPSRVLKVSPGQAKNTVKLTCLEDNLLIWETTHEKWNLDSLARMIAEDRLLTGDEGWNALAAGWRLHPFCPQCGGETRPIAYGLMSSDPGPEVAMGGCSVGPNDPQFNCGRCHVDLLIDGSGAPCVVDRHFGRFTGHRGEPSG
jgi:hypothetical protein